jgi:RimJ/RimL family protein N-acetyltransferase
MNIRRLKTGEALLYKKIRLESLKESPEAFASSYSAALERTAESWETQADRSATGSDRATFIAFDRDEPVGLAALYRDEKTATTGELLQVWISPHLRGRTMAVELMDAIFTWAKSNGFENIDAEVHKMNVRAIRFYKNYGFELKEKSSSENGDSLFLTKRVHAERS